MLDELLEANTSVSTGMFCKLIRGKYPICETRLQRFRRDCGNDLVKSREALRYYFNYVDRDAKARMIKDWEVYLNE